MIFDFVMIDTFYRKLDSRILEIRKKLKRPLTLSEKILLSHVYPQNQARSFSRGIDYVDFMPDRVAMQDATAQMAIKTVSSFDEAVDHISDYGSKHSEAIISENKSNIQLFYSVVDASSIYANASTAFTDGSEFGLGAEIGISTQKLHARGPMALEALTTYKWIIEGKGQIRK